LAACIALSVGIEAKAQERGSERPLLPLLPTLEELRTRLNLSPEQEAKIKAILEETREAMRKDREESAGDRRMALGRMRERIQTMDERVQAVLTEEQKATYAKMKEERREKMREEWRQRRSG
ncbi:MAG: hypothetical protein NZ844_02350, partial [Chloroherpetonaceae bacterium]|nr:hypothetical protein [Chloroherpetonaceae bacterium]